MRHISRAYTSGAANGHHKLMPVAVCFWLLMSACVCAQEKYNGIQSDGAWARTMSKQRHEALVFTTPAYRNEALRLVVEEANYIARALNLPEKLPIIRTELIES